MGPPMEPFDFCLGFRFRVWIPSFFMAMGRATLCKLKYKPHALHTGLPPVLRRHKVVVCV